MHMADEKSPPMRSLGRATLLSAVSVPLLVLRFRHESVSHAADGQQMFWLGRIVFDIAPQSDDEIIYRTSVSVFVQSPDFFQNCFARNDAAAVTNQMTQ